MAIQGSYDFKGIVLSDAYLQIQGVNSYFQIEKVNSLETPAVFAEDGVTVETEAVYVTTYNKNLVSSCNVNIFKDEAAKNANPENTIGNFSFNFTASLEDGAVNNIKQAYVALKAQEAYENYTDV